MFKPEYIRDDVALFGVTATVSLIAKRLQRLGRSKPVAEAMALALVQSTIGA